MSDDSEDLRLPPGRATRKGTTRFSSSDSESDDGVVALSARRKRMRVVSDEDTDSSGSSVGRPFTRRIRLLPQLQDSDNGSDALEDDSHRPNANATGPSTHVSGFASDSSEGNSEKCSICLTRFTDQEVGTPQTCEHIFCLDCITEWSKSVNTCPVDRLTFNSIVVRACAGGRVLRTEPVNVMPRRSSVDTILLFDSRICQICGDTDNEETMLLCDGCDLGYHMHCLNPPLSQIPIGDWHCPYCDNDVQDEDFSEIDDLISDIDIDFLCPMGPRPSPLRMPRNVRRSERHSNRNRLSTSLRHQTENSELASVPSTSRGSRSTAGSSSSSYSNIRSGTSVVYAPRRKKYNKRRTKTVILEYEVKGNNKCPVVKKLKRKIKKKVNKRKSRTTARQKHVRESVRAKLATLKMDHRQDLSQVSMASNEVQNLCVRRQRAGIPSLSLLGNPNQLDYFSDEEHEVSEGASTAVAIRSTSNLLNVHRQARRKMVTIPSPPHASSAPDFLSSILESQTLLHSKKSVLSISVDGNVNIKLETKQKSNEKKKSMENEQEGRLDLSKGTEGAKQAPSYPGHSRGGGGGWGGGYRGNYHRERGTTGFGRGSYNEGDYPGAPQNRQGNHFHRNDAGHRDEPQMFTDYARRTHRFSSSDETQFDRNRRYSDSNRGFGHSGPQQNDALVRSIGPTHLAGPVHATGPVSWRPYGPPPTARPTAPPLHRHSFGGFDDPLDMRTGGVQPQVLLHSPLRRPDSFIEESRLPATQPCLPLPDPPVFSFDTGTDLDKSEDERSDPDLVIDTDKYDPTEPTHDDDSPDEESTIPAPQQQRCAPALSPPPLPPEPPQSDALRDVIASLDVNVPSALLDSAVRQVLHEHRDLLVPPPPPNPRAEPSDEDSDGDCPNFSIYSATSVHIANNTSVLAAEQPPERPRDDLEDLVQEDDDGPSPTPIKDSTPEPVPNQDVDVTSKATRQPPLTRHYNFDISAKKKSEEYKEKVSKRCPITTNTRNPIKIKLNTPSLIKRPVSLYDDDEEEVEEELPETQVLESSMNAISPALIPKPLATFSEISVEPSKQTLDSDLGTPKPSFKAVEETNPVEKNDVNATEEPNDEGFNTHDIKLQTISNQQKDDDLQAMTVDDENADKHKHLNIQTETLNGPPENTKSSENEEFVDNTSEKEEQSATGLPLTSTDSPERNGEAPEKMTESISETEDERSYTPCLDENKSKDTSLETDKDKGIEGLDTEMISEDEGNEMFSDEEQARSERSRVSPPPVTPSAVVEDKQPSVKKQGKSDGETKKKKKKDSKKEGKDRSKNKRKADVVFRKLSKSGKERNYREREKQATERERRGSTPSAERDKRKRKRKEKRKDLERYDVRTVVGEKRRKRKDAFGRDVSPRIRSRSPSLSSPRRSPTPRHRSTSPRRRSTTPRRRSPSLRRRSPSPRRRSPTPRRCSPTPRRRSISIHRRSPTPRRRSPSPRHRSPTPRRRSPTPVRCSQSVARVSLSPILRRRRSQSTGRPSPSPRRGRRSRSPRSMSPRAVSPRPLRTSSSRGRRLDSRPDPRPDVRRRRGEPDRVRKRRRSVSASKSPRLKSTKRKKRARSERATSRRRKSPRRRRARRRSVERGVEPSPGPTPVPESIAVPTAWSPGSLAESRPPSPCTPPPTLEQEDGPHRRRELERTRHRRARDAGGASKEVFTSGDNILVSVSFKEQERGEDSERRSRRKERRRRRRRTTAPEPEGTTVRPVAIIDLERSPFRELTPSPRDVIVLSDSDAAEREPSEAPSAPVPPQQMSTTAPPPAEAAPTPAPEERGPTTPPDPPDSPDAYDPYEPTRSASASPSPAPPGSPPRTAITLETAQKTNMSADEVIDRRPLSPIEKVMALLQSTREVSPDPPPQDPSPAEIMTSTISAVTSLATGIVPAIISSAPTANPAAPVVPGATVAPPVRIVLPEAARTQAPKLFLAKPSPIKSDPIKPMPKPSRPTPAEADSPYSPGSSDFGELFSPPAGARHDPFDALIERATRRSRRTGHSGRSAARSAAARVPVRLDRNKGKTQVGVKIDEDNLKILDDLPSSAVEMQVKSKFLKKLNRQERVVEEVKLVLKPHYNKKHLTKDEYKDILRRAVPKICHNKSGEINPTKIQALIEAYVKKIRKKHKLGLL